MAKYTVIRGNEPDLTIEADEARVDDASSRITFYKDTGEKREVVASFINVQGWLKQ